MPTTRDLVFDRVTVDYLARGGARIAWRLFRQFTDPGPHDFAVEVGSTGNPLAEDWVAIGPPVRDVGEMIDVIQRGFARYSRITHYRVHLVTPKDEYRSIPAPVEGVLDKHDWLIAREIIRGRTLVLRKSTGIDGWLFKRKWVGDVGEAADPRTAVIDPVDGSVIRSTAAETVGTAFVGGFFAPIPFRVEATTTSHYEDKDDNRGSIDDVGIKIEGQCVVFPEIRSGDVFVAAGSDRRYNVHPTRNTAERRGVPLLSAVELRLAPASDAIYGLEVPR